MSEEDVECLTKKETSKTEDHHEQSKSENSEHPVVPGKEGDGDAPVSCETLVKQELDECDSYGRPIDETSTNWKGSSSEQPETKEDSLVGKLKVRPFASIAEPIQLNPSFHQANLHYGGVQHVPQAHQRFPLNLAFPHSYKLPTTNKKPGTKEYVTNNGFAEPQVYMKNQGLQFLLNSNCYSDRGNFLNSSTMLDRTLSMRFPGQGVPFCRSIGQSRIPTTDISIPNYIPLNIPSVLRRPVLHLPTSVAISSSVPNTIAPLNPDLNTASSGIASSSSSLENANTSSEVNGPMDEEIKSEIKPDSPETLATELSTSHSTSTNTNMIVKDELDLGVSTAEGHGEYNPNNLNNFGNHFLMSDSTATKVPTDPSTSTNINMIVGTELNSDFTFGGRKRSDPNDSNRFLTSDDFCIPKYLENRYHDVDTDDLLPACNPVGKRLCRYCDYRHNSDDVLKRHREKLHSKKYNHRCFLCTRPDTYSLPSYHILEHHVATVHRGEKRFQCPKCKRSFKKKRGLKIHLARMCRIIDPFACHLCNFTCRTMSVLERHRAKHDETTEECPVCLKSVRKLFMKQHMHNHSGTKTKKCEKCDFNTASKAKMLKHYGLTFHNRKFQCKLCNYATNSEEVHKNHVSTCNNDKNRRYVCTVPGCGRIFKFKQAYAHHSHIHTFPETSVFRCPDKNCDYETIVQATIVRHMKLTKHNLQFKCPDCTLRFAKEESLAAHIQKVHVEKIIRELGFPLPVEDNDPVVADQNDTEDYEDETDPYAHFKKGWLGISCFEEEENTTNQPSDTLDTGSTLSAVEPLGKLPSDEPEFTHVVPEISCMVECTSDFSDQTHSNINLHSDTDVYCDTEAHETMIVTPSIDLLNSATDSEDKTSLDVVNYNEVDEFSIKPDPDLYDNPPKIECSDTITVTPSLDFVLNHMDADEDQITPNSPGESCAQVDDLSVKSDPESENVEAPSVFFPGMQRQHLEIEGQSDYIKPDPEEILVDAHAESMIITPSIDFLSLEQ